MLNAPYFRMLPPSKILSRAAVSIRPDKAALAYGVGSLLAADIAPVKMGFVSLGGAFSAIDVKLAAQMYGLPEPNIKIINVNGARQQDDTGGADVENMLDICCQFAAWSACTGQPADITIGLAPNDDTGIGDGFQALKEEGVEASSISWGSPESNWTPQARQYTEGKFFSCQQAGMWMFPASGDNSENDGTASPQVDYPCGSPYVWAVGGTRLEIAVDGTIAAERAWGDGRPGDDGGGGGYDHNFPKPSWQTQVQGFYRGAPDSSANADPLTGYLIVSGGRQISVGGTSGAAPLTAAIFALLRGKMKKLGMAIPPALGPVLYTVPVTPFNDITTGSNGLPAAAGWDAATGLGSPNVPHLWAALTGATVPMPPSPPPVPIPPSPPLPPAPPVHCPTQQAMLGAVDAEFSLIEQQLAARPGGFYMIPTIMLTQRAIDATIRKVYQQS